MYLLKAESLKESAYGAVQATETKVCLISVARTAGRSHQPAWSCGVGKCFVGPKCKNPSVKGPGMGLHRHERERPPREQEVSSMTTGSDQQTLDT